LSLKSCAYFSIAGLEKNPALSQAFGLLKNVAETMPSMDSTDAFSPDLYVLCSELAFQVSMLHIMGKINR